MSCKPCVFSVYSSVSVLIIGGSFLCKKTEGFVLVDFD